MDDTWINITNLLRLVNTLKKVYDPSTDLILRGALNDEFPDRDWLSGGSGWLMSRAMVQAHSLPAFALEIGGHQVDLIDDLLETVVVQSIFPHRKTWADAFFVEGLWQIGPNELISWQKNDYGSVDPCKDREIYPANSLVGLHSHDHPEYMDFARMWGKFPPNMYAYHLKNSRRVGICEWHPDYVNPKMTVCGLRRSKANRTLDWARHMNDEYVEESQKVIEWVNKVEALKQRDKNATLMNTDWDVKWNRAKFGKARII
jgi:hypothetical protein